MPIKMWRVTESRNRQRGLRRVIWRGRACDYLRFWTRSRRTPPQDTGQFSIEQLLLGAGNRLHEMLSDAGSFTDDDDEAEEKKGAGCAHEPHHVAAGRKNTAQVPPPAPSQSLVTGVRAPGMRMRDSPLSARLKKMQIFLVAGAHTRAQSPHTRGKYGLKPLAGRCDIGARGRGEGVLIAPMRVRNDEMAHQMALFFIAEGRLVGRQTFFC